MKNKNVELQKNLTIPNRNGLIFLGCDGYG